MLTVAARVGLQYPARIINGSGHNRILGVRINLFWAIR